MKISLSTRNHRTLAADLLVLPHDGGDLAEGSPLAELAASLPSGELTRLLADEGFKGKRDQVVKLRAPEGWSARTIVIAGTKGEGDEGDLGFHLAAAALKSAKEQRNIGLVLGDASTDAIRGAARGALGTAYRYTAHKTEDDEKRPITLTLLVASTGAAQKRALNEGVIVAESINFARDLVNAPPNELTPIRLAEHAKDVAKERGVSLRVFDKKQLERLKMDLFLAVNKASAIEPRMVHLAYKPGKKARARIAFVGKGLTFDSGGLCLKPADAMIDMKCDMAGAAATLAIVQAAARLALPIEVHGVIGATENMIGPNAYRPGDIYRSYLGKTVEIINTDAEGRLVLADVLAWTNENVKPDLIVDHATLTGACMIALGNYRAGLFANSDVIAERYLGAQDGEPFWRLPLDDALRPQLKSEVADIKHTGTRYGGTITAALFLREFIGETPWLHLDIAGPAFLSSPHGRHPRGGTGFGVATAIRYLTELGEDKDGGLSALLEESARAQERAKEKAKTGRRSAKKSAPRKAPAKKAAPRRAPAKKAAAKKAATEPSTTPS